MGQSRFPNVIDGDRIVLVANSITVQPGDVIGYFTSTINGNGGADTGVGIWLDTNFASETVWYHSNTLQDPLLQGLSTCVFQVGRDPERVLSSLTNAAPVVSANIRK